MSKPNILWICTDQQRTDTIHCYGNPYVRTPHIDKLAEEGVRFTRAYCQSPVCTPSRGSFLTGRYPRTTRCRQNGQKMPAEEKLISKLFAEQGYDCGLIGKLHLAPCHPDVCEGPEERGDDGYRVFRWSHAVGGMHEWKRDDYRTWLAGKKAKSRKEPIPGSRQVFYGHDPEHRQGVWCVDEAIDFLNSGREKDEPWFCSVNFYDPHHPFDPPKALMEKYLNQLDDVPLPHYEEGELNEKTIYQRIDSAKAYNFASQFCFQEMSDYEHKVARASQWALVEHLDAEIGRLLRGLEESGQKENTLVIFMSDHGEMLGDHGIYWKGPYFYEELVRVPLIISWPGVIQEGIESTALVELVDLAPALLEAAELPPYPGMQGKSLWSLLIGDAAADYHRDSIYCEYYNAQPWHPDNPPQCTMVSDGKYKLVRVHSSNEGELYDLENDPMERHNLYSDDRVAAVRIRMLEKLADRMAWTVDPLPVRTAPW